MTTAIRLAGLAVGFATLSGCGNPPAATPPAPPAAPAGISYELRGEAGGNVAGVAETFSANVGNRTLEVKDGRVRANGRDYGPVKGGDKVLLDRDGKLYVNGTEVKPVPE